MSFTPYEKIKLDQYAKELEFRNTEQAREWLPKQIEALIRYKEARKLVDFIPRLLYGGAVGGGKSFFGARCCIDGAERIRNNHLYACRKESVTFKNTTLATFLDPPPDGLELLSRPNWFWHKSEQYFYNTYTKSKISYGGLSSDPLNRQKLKGMYLGGLFIDEASEVDKESAYLAMSRVGRKQWAHGKEFIVLTSNPEQCWLIDEFLSSERDGYIYIPALPKDNYKLPPDYFRNLEETYADVPELLAAYLNGDWNAIGLRNQVFNFRDVDKAMKRMIEAGQPIEYGVDVSQGKKRDSSTIIRRRGLKFEIVEESNVIDPRELAIICKHVNDAVPGYWKIDATGVGGGISPWLVSWGIPAVDIMVGSGSNNPVRYANFKAEINWAARNLLHYYDIDLENNDRFRRELLAVTYRIVNGRIWIEPKEKLIERLGKSPDLGDAFVLAATPLPAEVYESDGEVQTVTYETDTGGISPI